MTTMTYKRWIGMKKKNTSTNSMMKVKGIPKTTPEFKIFDQNPVFFHISTTIWQEKCWAYRLPELLYYLAVLCHLSPLPRYLTPSELPFVYCPVPEVHLPTTLPHSILKLSFVPLPNFSLFRVVNSPSIEFIIVPLTLIFKFMVWEVELSSSANSVIIPFAIVPAPIFELVFSFAVFEASLFLSNIFVSIGILFNDFLHIFCFSFSLQFRSDAVFF